MASPPIRKLTIYTSSATKHEKFFATKDIQNILIFQCDLRKEQILLIFSAKKRRRRNMEKGFGF